MKQLHPFRRIGPVARCSYCASFRIPFSHMARLVVLMAAFLMLATGPGGARVAVGQELVPPDSNTTGSAPAQDGFAPRSLLTQTPDQQRPDDFDGRVRAIHERIDLIKSLIEREKKSQTEPNVPVEPAATEVSPKPTVSQAATPDRAQAVPTFENTPPVTAEHGTDQAPMPPTIPLDAQPVEAFELASSLYMTGNYAKAREIYERLLKKPLPREQAAWARVLLGNCLWHLGETDQAEIVYRDLTREKEGLYPVEFARLSLTELDRHRRIASRWAAIENGLSQYLNQPSEESQDE